MFKLGRMRGRPCAEGPCARRHTQAFGSRGFASSGLREGRLRLIAAPCCLSCAPLARADAGASLLFCLAFGSRRLAAFLSLKRLQVDVQPDVFRALRGMRGAMGPVLLMFFVVVVLWRALCLDAHIRATLRNMCVAWCWASWGGRGAHGDTCHRGPTGIGMARRGGRGQGGRAGEGVPQHSAFGVRLATCARGAERESCRSAAIAWNHDIDSDNDSDNQRHASVGT